MDWTEVVHELIPVLRRERQVDVCDFEASLLYKS